MGKTTLYMGGKEVDMEALTVNFGERSFKINGYDFKTGRIELQDMNAKTTIKLPVLSVFCKDTPCFLQTLLEVRPDFFI